MGRMAAVFGQQSAPGGTTAIAALSQHAGVATTAALADAFGTTFWVAAALIGTALVPALLLPSHRRNQANAGQAPEWPLNRPRQANQGRAGCTTPRHAIAEEHQTGGTSP